MHPKTKAVGFFLKFGIQSLQHTSWVQHRCPGASVRRRHRAGVASACDSRGQLWTRSVKIIVSLVLVDLCLATFVQYRLIIIDPITGLAWLFTSGEHSVPTAASQIRHLCHGLLWLQRNQVRVGTFSAVATPQFFELVTTKSSIISVRQKLGRQWPTLHQPVATTEASG